MLLPQHKGRINVNWILLDSQSTIDMFYNRKLLKNIRKSEETIDIHCNAGVTTTNMVGDLDGYGTVWYDPHGIANILSLHRVIEKYRVQFDSRGGNRFTMWCDGGSTRKFLPGRRGLYYCDITRTEGTILAMNGNMDHINIDSDLTHVTTVK